MRTIVWIGIVAGILLMSGIAAPVTAGIETGNDGIGQEALSSTGGTPVPDASAELVTIQYWVNGVKYTLPAGTEHIYVTLDDMVTFAASGRYTGPDGTYGILAVNEQTDPLVKDAYKIIPARKTTKVKCTQAWQLSAPGERLFTIGCMGPQGVHSTSVGELRVAIVHWSAG